MWCWSLRWLCTNNAVHRSRPISVNFHLCVCVKITAFHLVLFGSTNIPQSETNLVFLSCWRRWLLKEERKRSVFPLFGKFCFCLSLSLEMSLWHVTNLLFPLFFLPIAKWMVTLLTFGGSPIRGGRRGANGGLTRGVNHLQLKSHKTQMNLWPLEKGDPNPTETTFEL